MESAFEHSTFADDLVIFDTVFGFDLL